MVLLLKIKINLGFYNTTQTKKAIKNYEKLHYAKDPIKTYIIFFFS